MTNKILIGVIACLLVCVGLLAYFAFTKSNVQNINPEIQTITDADLNIDEKLLPDETETSDDQIPVDETVKFTGAGLHISIHIEPTSTDQDLVTQWESNVAVVEIADAHDMKLSLHFSAQTAEYVLDSFSRFALVRSWEENGHEIGFHHHGTSHVQWDGYTNDGTYSRRFGYKGNMDDFMEIVSQLPASGLILVGSGTDGDVDWPKGVIYGSKGSSPPSIETLLSEPLEVEYNGQPILELGKGPIFVDWISGNGTIADIEEALEDASQSEFLGINMSDKTMGDHLDEVNDMFSLIADFGVASQPIADLLR